MDKFLLFIPCYNCAQQLPRVLDKVAPIKDLFEEIIVVDNRSNDGTAEVAKALSIHFPQMKVMVNQFNYNLGGSHKVAFNYALSSSKGFTHIIVLHGDDQADINDLLPQLKEGWHHRYDCLLGARFHPESKLIGYSAFRTLGNKILNVVCSIVCKKKVLDMGSGLNMYALKMLKDQAYLQLRNDLTFNIYLLFHTCFENYSIRFFPISWREDDQISNAKVIRQMIIIMGLSIRSLLNPKAVYPLLKAPEEYRYDYLN